LGRKQCLYINSEEITIYPQIIMGRFPWMSYVQPDAWCHQMMLKKLVGYGQITVILAANINPISVGYTKLKMFSK